jgi:exo-1,4-beta-D-glucosaminidase
VPSTVVAALVADKTFPDPYFGQNLRDIPGASYPAGQNFSVLAMPENSPFRCSWWYRVEFRLPAAYAGRHVWLNFEGINNRANIWVNGRRIAGSKEVAGAYRTYEFDVTSFVSQSKANVLAVETIAQKETDLGINWVDWNPAPPDKDMGLWRDVYLRPSGPVTIRYPQVITHFPAASLERADLTVEAELHNASARQATGTLSGKIEQAAFEKRVTLGPGESSTVRLTTDEFPQLEMAHPKVWWPAQMGTPNLHELSLQFATENGEISDSESIRFGIREIASEVDRRGHRVFRVNGERILVRGAGWAPDMLLRESSDRLQNEFRYIRDLNLNAIRLEGKMETDAFYNLADEQGLLVMAGCSCCDYL